MKSKCFLMLIMAVLLAAGPAFAGDVISVNFASNWGAVGSNTAGVAPVGNWTDYVVSGTISALPDDTGAATAADITVTGTGNGPYTYGFSPSIPGDPGSSAMLTGHIYTWNVGNVVHAAFTGIPFAEYDVYVYFDGNGGGASNLTNFTIGATTITGMDAAGVDTALVESNATTNGNYVVFEGLTDPNIIIDSETNGGAGDTSIYTSFSGVQIVSSDYVFPPAVTLRPRSQSVDIGDPVTFTVAADNMGSGTYQWRLDTGSGPADISGATSASYTDNDVQAGDLGDYDCVLTNSGGTVISDYAVLAEKALVAHYQFGGAPNDSINGNDCTVAGGTSWDTTTTTPTGDTKSLAFDGINGTCKRTADTIELPIKGMPYTHEVWLNIDEDAEVTSGEEEYLPVIECGTLAGDSSIISELIHLLSYRTNFYTFWHTASEGSTTGIFTVPDPCEIGGRWMHYAATYDGTDRKMYVDGKLMNTSTLTKTYNIDETGDFLIGCSVGVGTDYFEGLIDDVKVYNYARTGTQIAAAVYAGNGGNPVCMEDNEMDFNEDCEVNFVDFADFAAEWLIDNIYTP